MLFFVQAALAGDACLLPRELQGLMGTLFTPESHTTFVEKTPFIATVQEDRLVIQRMDSPVGRLGDSMLSSIVLDRHGNVLGGAVLASDGGALSMESCGTRVSFAQTLLTAEWR